MTRLSVGSQQKPADASSSSSSSTKAPASATPAVDPNSVVCKQCGKVVLKTDFEWHAASHYAADTASQSSSSSSSSSSPAPAANNPFPPLPQQRPQPQFVDFPSLSSSSKAKEGKTKAVRSSYTGALTGVTPGSLPNTYKFDPASLPSSSSSSAPSSSSSHPSYSQLVTGQAVAPIEALIPSYAGASGGKKKGKGKVLLHFG